jgi:hypothetical protein
MRIPTIAAVLAATLLAGCGGGGSSGPSSTPTGNSPSGTQLSTQDVLQSATDAAFEPIDTAESDAAVLNGSLGSSSTLRSVQSVAHGCRNHTTRTVTVNADNSVTVETIRYFDAACTQVERDAVATFAVSAGTATVARTITTFNKAHLQLDVRKQNYALAGSTSNGSWTVMTSFFPGTSATAMSQYSHNATLNANAYAATTGRIVNNAKPSVDASYGRQAATTATVNTDASNDVTFTGTRNGIEFKGAFGALSISAAPPFTISGGTQLGTSQLNGAITFDSDGDLTAVALTGTLPGGNTINVTSSTDSSGNVTVSGTITSPSNAPVATFQTDADGNGILTLADGTQVPIVDWQVVWS